MSGMVMKCHSQAFNSSLDGLSLLIPAGWSADYAATRCETACTANATCVGFTLYMNGKTLNPRECTFRAGVGGCKNKPPLAGSTTRCYEKAADAVRTCIQSLQYCELHNN